MIAGRTKRYPGGGGLGSPAGILAGALPSPTEVLLERLGSVVSVVNWQDLEGRCSQLFHLSDDREVGDKWSATKKRVPPDVI